MDGVLLAGGSADPLYRRAARVSMGTVFQIPWTVTGDVPFSLLKSLGFAAAAMALTDKSVAIDDPRLMKETKKAVILGNEGDGLPEDIIRSSDYVVRIPMAHGVDSLNVAAASAVAFWSMK
jgi:tRNA G18 (ribose-2'-O)-methylase SpoU